MFPAVHWFMVPTTSASVTIPHGGSFPFILHGPERVVDDVVVVVEVEVTEYVVVVEAFWVVVVVDKDVLVDVVELVVVVSEA